jgi:phage tail sheath protein FI
MANIGVNVVETNGSASPAIQGAPTSVAAFLVRTRRGPTDSAVGVSSWGQFVERFGAHYKDAAGTYYMGAYAFQGFLLNGGSRAFVRRVAGSGAAAAAVTLPDRQGNAAACFKVTAAYRGTADVGAWGNELAVKVKENPAAQVALAADATGATPGSLTGTVANKFDLSAGNLTLTITVAGQAAPTIVFDAASGVAPLNAAPASMVASLINAQAPTVRATVDGSGNLVLTTRLKGSTATISVAGTAVTALGLGGTATAGANGGAGYSTMTVGSVAGLKPGMVVRISDGLTADYRTLTSVQAVPQPGGGMQYTIGWSASAPVTNAYTKADGTAVSTCEFNLEVWQAQPDGTMARMENWERVTMDPGSASYAPLRLNDKYAGSKFIKLDDMRTDGTNTGAAMAFRGFDSPAPTAAPVTLGIGTTPHTRKAGADGQTPSVPDYQAALASFDLYAVQLVCAPEEMPLEMLRAVTKEGIAYCTNRGDCLWVGQTPATADQAAAIEFGRSLQGAKVYGALYWPWITVNDPLGNSPVPTLNIPPTGHLLGVYARIDTTRGVWKAPAGDEAQILGALDVTQAISDVDHTTLVKDGSVNGIRFIRGAGIVVDASRTLSTDTRWLYINVRLLFNFVKSSLREGLRWVKQEPNRDNLWNSIKYNTVEPFLMGLWRRGAFGTGKPAEVFTVKVDAENNPPDEVDKGNLKVEVYFYPSKPAETIVIEVGQQPGASSAKEG